MYNFQVGNDRAVDICQALAIQNLDHENRLLFAVAVFYPTQSAKIMIVRDLRTLPSLPKTTGRAMMLCQRLCMKRLILIVQVEFQAIRTPLPMKNIGV